MERESDTDMYNIRKVTDDITWIGASDRRLALFENIFPISRGVSYNSYILVDEQTVLFDTVDASVAGQFFENLEAVLEGRTLDYLIVNHMEPDHCAMIGDIVRRYPDVKIVGNTKTFGMMNQFFGTDFAERSIVVKEGDTLSAGKHTLHFVMAPMVHWPETMVTYDDVDKVLFSADGFGSFGALNGNIFADEVDFDRDWLDDARRYYTNIVGKYGQPAQTALKKLGGLPIKMVCATHGPIRRSHIADIVAKYDKWSKYDTDKGVVIVFSSMYGNTEKMADIIARFLAEKGIKKIRIHDASKTHPSYIINDIFRYKGVILGSCAYNGNAFPTMETLLFELEHMGVKNHVVAFFGGKAWAGGAMPRFNQFAEKIKWEVVAPSCEACGCPKDEDFEMCRNIAYAMAAKLDEIC